MGAGASSGVAAGLGSASDEDLKALLMGVPKEERARLLSALADAPGDSTSQTTPAAPLDAALMELFQIYDLDKGGFITIDEMLAVDREFSKSCGSEFKEEESRASFKESDCNKDGKVALSEYTAYFKSLGTKAELEEDALLGMVKQTMDILKVAKPSISLDDSLNALFLIYDLDKSSFVTIDEMMAMDKEFSKACGSEFIEEESRANFKESDANKDGKVALSEYADYFKALGKKAGLGDDALTGMVRQTMDVLSAAKP